MGRAGDPLAKGDVATTLHTHQGGIVVMPAGHGGYRRAPGQE